MKLHKGDTVKIMIGKDRGKTGKVLESFPEDGRVIVEGLNMIKKRSRPRRQGEVGQMVNLPRPLPASRVRLVCPNCKNAVRVGYRMDGPKKVRYCKKCEANI
jgi:large subunit ribosomal protein L24